MAKLRHIALGTGIVLGMSAAELEGWMKIAALAVPVITALLGHLHGKKKPETTKPSEGDKKTPLGQQ